MSTKIYDGFRIPSAKLNDFIRLYRGYMFRKAAKSIKEWTSRLDPEKCLKTIGEDGEGGWVRKPGWEERAKLTMIFAVLMKESDSRRGGLNYDTSFNVWLDGKWAYINPYDGDFNRKSSGHYPFLKKLGGEDFCYWDNTDWPKGMTEKEWIFRGKTWERLCLNDWHASRLSHVVIEGQYPFIGFSELENMILGKNNHYMVVLGAMIARDHLKKVEKAEQKASGKSELIEE